MAGAIRRPNVRRPARSARPGKRITRPNTLRSEHALLSILSNASRKTAWSRHPARRCANKSVHRSVLSNASRSAAWSSRHLFPGRRCSKGATTGRHVPRLPIPRGILTLTGPVRMLRALPFRPATSSGCRI